MSGLNLQKMGINSSEELTLKNANAEVKNVIRKIGKVNNQIVDLVEEADTDSKELKKIRDEIKLKCEKLNARKKELQLKSKKRNELMLLLLGERNAWAKELSAHGVKLQKDPITSALPKNKHEVKQLVEA